MFFLHFVLKTNPGPHRKKWQQCFSCLEMYFGGNNRGCKEYSKKFAFYTQANRLFVCDVEHTSFHFGLCGRKFVLCLFGQCMFVLCLFGQCMLLSMFKATKIN